jgi:hypothetical protein
MEIKNTTIIKTAEAKTSKALYQIEYSIINEVLGRVHVAIYKNNSGVESGPYIGNISYENEMVTCSLPIGSKTAEYFADFETYLSQIKTETLSDK